MKKLKRLLVFVCAAVMLMLPALSLAETAEPAQDAKLPTEIITEYTKLDMTPYAGKAVYMNFFTEWCPYCMKEMPDIKRLYDEYDPETLQIILVHVWDGEDASNTDSIREKYGLDGMTFYEDEDMALSSLVGLPGYPMSMFLDAEGNVANAAAQMLTYEQMVSAVESIGAVKKAEVKP